MGRDDSIDIIVPSPKKVVSVKLDIDIINEIDRVWRSLGYSSRSEFLREAILFYLQFVKKNQGQVGGSGSTLSTAIPADYSEELNDYLDGVRELVDELEGDGEDGGEEAASS